MNYFNLVLEQLSNTTDYVLIYEYCMCIHEMLKEIDYWLKQSHGTGPSFGGMTMLTGMGSSLRRVGTKSGSDLLNFGDDCVTDQDEQIKMS